LNAASVLTPSLVAGFIVVAVAVVAAQEPGPGPFGRGGQGPLPGRFGGMPPRDDGSAAKGTARISGRVVAADSGSPLRRAQVRVTSTEARANRSVTTDNEGRYEVTGLPAARYRLQVNKAGYVTLEYGQSRPFEAGKPLDLTDGQVLDKIDFSLPRGSVITGRVTDEFGEPFADAQVQAMRYQFINGERQLVSVGRTATTDDIGQFRLFGLMPGDYIVRASARGNQPVAAVIAAVEEPSGYPVTYYPGTSDLAQAQIVTVALGQELTSVAFPLSPARLARVSGTVMSSTGGPLVGAVVVARPIAGGGAGPMNVGGGNQVRADGTFTISNLPPGDYTIDVQQRPRNLQNFQIGDLSQLEFASVPLTVSGSDISGLTILTTTGVTASGRVVFQGQAGQKPNARGMQVSALGQQGRPGMMAFAGRALGGGRVNDDGTFELRGLAGPQIIRATGVPAGWTVKSITIDGADITDGPFEFKPGDNVSTLVVTLTDRVSEVTGTVRDTKGAPVADFALVVFAEDARLWRPQSRYVATTRPNQNGTFSIKGLPPGRYLAAVVASFENGLQNDPAVLEQLRSGSSAFVLGDGQALNLNLQMPAQ
jgi:hypothetical protein